MAGKNASEGILPDRRTALRAMLGIGLALPVARLAAADEQDPKRVRPQSGDLLVFAVGERRNAPIAASDLPLGGPPTMAYAMDPTSRVIRDGTRLNKILLVRFEPGQLSGRARDLAAEGVVAYSAVCTHTGCDVSAWKSDKAALFCPCHYSEYDPKSDARVVAGPAPRPLPALPLKVADGILVAAGGFSGRIGNRQM